MFAPDDSRTEEELKQDLRSTLALLRLAFELAEARQEGSKVGLAIVTKSPDGSLDFAMPLAQVGDALLRDTAQLAGYSAYNGVSRQDYMLGLMQQHLKS